MKKSQTTKNNTARTSFVRTDLTTKDLMAAHPSSRWDPGYWNPKYEILQQMKITKPLSDFIPEGTMGLTYGAIITGKKNKNVGDGVPLVGAEQIIFTGLDLGNVEKTQKDSQWDPERSRVMKGDVLLVRSGVGSLGKSAVYQGGKYINIGCFVDRIHVNHLSPQYLDVFFKTIFGSLQVERFTTGVAGTTNISFDQIRSIEIPLLTEKTQQIIESEYKKMATYHDKAMEAKKKNDEAGYKKNIETAEKMLKDLIAKTEAVIRGERKDII